ncbi:MAG: glycosyltransferase family 2 protein [Acidobacteriota bacterium]
MIDRPSKKDKKAGACLASDLVSDVTTHRPFVSVVMPVRNEAAFIERSVGSVLKQDYAHSLLEIVIADGVSTDDTIELIDKLSGETDIPIKVVLNPKKIAPAALNLAIAESRGQIIIRIDGHCEIDPDYVSNCVSLLTEGKADGVGGPIETIGDGLQAKAIAMAMSSTFGVGGSAFRTVNNREMLTDSVAFPGYTREIIERAGPFNEELIRNQDDEYNYRIRKLGGRILLSPDIRSKYYSRSTFSSLWRQYFQYGYWKVRVLQLHPKQMSVRQFIPFLFVLTIVALIIGSLIFAQAFWALCAIEGIYLTAAVLASLVAARGRLKFVPYLALSFTILHLSYGLGSAVGLVAFRKRWGGTNLAAEQNAKSVSGIVSR